MQKLPMNVGDEFTVDFIKNQRGGKPICRIEGIIGFISNKEKSFVAPCSSWTVRIDEIKESCLIVTPLLKMHTAKENIDNTNEMLEKLKSTHTPKQAKVAIKKGYQYKSFAELKAEKENVI